MRTLVAVAIAVCVLLTSVTCWAASPKPITDKEVLQFVKQALDTAGATDDLLEGVLQEQYQGIPYLTWFKAAMLAYTTVGHVREKQYGYIVKDLCEAGFSKGLKLSGYGSFASIVAVTAMIADALDAFYQAAQRHALDSQIGGYVQYRRLGHSHQDIIATFRDGEGWLIPPQGTSYLGDAPRGSGLTPDQVIAVAKGIYEISSRPDLVDRDVEALRQKVLARVEELRKDGEPAKTPLLQKLTDWLRGAWASLRDWLAPRAKASDFPYEQVLAIRDYGGFYATEEGEKPWERQGTKAGEEIIGPDGGRMVWVPAGEFMMGSPDGEGAWDEHPQHRVRITKGFWLGKCEVTNAQYAAFLNAHGSNQDGSGNRLIYEKGYDSWTDKYSKVAYVGGTWVALAGWENHPMICITWYGAKAYCDHYGLRLPTEAEWEHAARGSEGRNYPWGDDCDASKCCCWENHGPACNAGMGPGTMPVGSLPAGDSWCGASDLAGNVLEWCNDWWDSSYYSGSPTDDPQGPLGGSYRLRRGGSWFGNCLDCRSADRSYFIPWLWGFDYGFRVVRTP